MKVFFTVCAMFLIKAFVAQNVVSLKYDKPLDSVYTYFGKTELYKPYREEVSYVLRFEDLKKDMFGKDKSKVLVSLTNSKGESYEFDYQPVAKLLKEKDSSSTHLSNGLGVTITIPKDYFKISKEKMTLTLIYYSGIVVTAKFELTVFFNFQQPEILTLDNWENGGGWQRSILHITQQKNELEILSHKNKSTDTETHKVCLYSNEKFIRPYSVKASGMSFGLIHVPFKYRLFSPYSRELIVLNLQNIGLNIGLLNHKSLVYLSDGSVTRRNFGLGVFALPSIQSIRHVESTYSNPFGVLNESANAAFLGTGLNLYYAWNNFSVNVIPLAFDFHLNNDYGYTSIHSGRYFVGVGMGYFFR